MIPDMHVVVIRLRGTTSSINVHLVYERQLRVYVVKYKHVHF